MATGVNMTDITNAITNAIAIVKRRIDVNNLDTSDQELVELYFELAKAITAVRIRKKIEKILEDFDCYGKDITFDSVLSDYYRQEAVQCQEMNC